VLAIFRNEGVSVEVYASVGLISETVFDDLLYVGHNVIDVFCDPCGCYWPRYTQVSQISLKLMFEPTSERDAVATAADVTTSDILSLLSFSGDDFVIHIGHSHNMYHVVAKVVPQDALQDVDGNIVACVTYVSVIIYRGTTRVPSNEPFASRQYQRSHIVGQAVEDSNASVVTLWTPPGT